MILNEPIGFIEYFVDLIVEEGVILEVGLCDAFDLLELQFLDLLLQILLPLDIGKPQSLLTESLVLNRPLLMVGGAHEVFALFHAVPHREGNLPLAQAIQFQIFYHFQDLLLLLPCQVLGGCCQCVLIHHGRVEVHSRLLMTLQVDTLDEVELSFAGFLFEKLFLEEVLLVSDLVD